jgi:hypothetical protein
MPRNVEIKAHIASVEALVPKAAAIADRGPIEIIQDDTFYGLWLSLSRLFSATGRIVMHCPVR